MKKVILTFVSLVSIIPAMAQEIKENILENATYVQRMAQFKADPLKQGQVIFFGNSLTQGGKWNEYFPAQAPANRGISGDNTSGMLGRLHEVIAAKPKKIFILAGTNDVSLNRPKEKVLTNIRSMIYQIKDGSPDTQIYIQSLLPLNNDFAKYSRMKGKETLIEEINKGLKQICKEQGVTFIDLYPHFLQSKRKLRADWTGDGLHLNDAGYAKWVEVIRAYVE